MKVVGCGRGGEVGVGGGGERWECGVVRIWQRGIYGSGVEGWEDTDRREDEGTKNITSFVN